MDFHRETLRAINRPKAARTVEPAHERRALWVRQGDHHPPARGRPQGRADPRERAARAHRAAERVHLAAGL
jgi:hypothetical protein